MPLAARQPRVSESWQVKAITKENGMAEWSVLTGPFLGAEHGRS